MPKTSERMQLDLTGIWERLPDSITDSLFRNTVKVLVEQHYIKEGLLKKENGAAQ